MAAGKTARVADLAGILDGGPHEDPREAEAEELLNDGEVEESWEEDEHGEVAAKKPEKAVAKPDKVIEKAVPAKPEVLEKEEKEAETGVETKADTKPASEEEETEPVDPKTQYKTIPYPRFRKELLKRHQLAADVAAERAKREDLERRLSAFEASATKAADPEPDPTLSPAEHISWENRQLKARLDKLETAQKPVSAPALPPAAAEQLVQALREDAEEVKAERPDFMEAYNHAIRVAAGYFAQQAPGLTQDQLQGAVRQAELVEIRKALDAGESPAEHIYALALRNGYLPPKAGKDSTVGAESEEKPDVGAAAARDRVIEAAEDAARRKRAGTVAGKGAPRRSSDEIALTEDQIDAMSNEELVKLMDANSGKRNPLSP